MFDISQLLKHELLEDYVTNPVKVTGQNVIRGFSDEYNIYIDYTAKIYTAKKRRKQHV